MSKNASNFSGDRLATCCAGSLLRHCATPISPPTVTLGLTCSPGLGIQKFFHSIPTTGLPHIPPQNAKNPTAMAGLSARNVKQNFGRRCEIRTRDQRIMSRVNRENSNNGKQVKAIESTTGGFKSEVQPRYDAEFCKLVVA